MPHYDITWLLEHELRSVFHEIFVWEICMQKVWVGMILQPAMWGWSTRLFELSPLTGTAAWFVMFLQLRYYHWYWECNQNIGICTVYPKKYAHGFVVLCFVVVMQSSIMISHEVFIHIHQGCFAGTGAIVRLPQCQWSKPGEYGKISQCITTTKHSKAVTVCIFFGIYCKIAHELAKTWFGKRYSIVHHHRNIRGQKKNFTLIEMP